MTNDTTPADARYNDGIDSKGNYVEVRVNSRGNLKKPFRVYVSGAFVASYRTREEAMRKVEQLRASNS